MLSANFPRKRLGQRVATTNFIQVRDLGVIVRPRVVFKTHIRWSSRLVQAQIPTQGFLTKLL